MENPYCKCKLTRVRSRCRAVSFPADGRAEVVAKSSPASASGQPPGEAGGHGDAQMGSAAFEQGDNDAQFAPGESLCILGGF